MNIGKKRTLSVDLGSTRIRVCYIHGNSHKFAVTYYDELEIPLAIENKDDFIKTEGRAFIKRQPSNMFYASLPGRGLLIRTLNIPKVPLKKIYDILKYEVQQQIPFPLDMVEWKYQILSEENQTFNILLAAAKKELINYFLNRLSLLGINNIYLDTDLFACFNAFIFSEHFRNDKCQVILEIGANTSNLIIHHKEKILMRSLTTAGDTITNAIAEAESISYVEAEQKKITEGLQLPLVVTSFENLNTEVQNSIDYWRFTQKGPEVEEIYLCGQSVLFKNFKEFFQEKVKIPTNYFNVFSNIDLNSQYSFLQPRAVEFAVLTGIALRESKQTFINLDMLPAEIESMREFRQNRPYIYISAIMAGLIAITPTLFYNQDKAMLKGLLSEINISLQQYEKYKPEVDALKNEISALEGKQGVIKGVISSKMIWLKRILDIGQALPTSRIYIVSLTSGGGGGATPGPGGAPGSGGPPSPSPNAMPPETGGESVPPKPSEEPPPGEGVPPTVQPTGQSVTPGSEVTVSEEKVFTLNGEVVITDIRSAFSDFKTFVSETKNLPFIEKTEIKSCEINTDGEKIEFSLIIYLK